METTVSSVEPSEVEDVREPARTLEMIMDTPPITKETTIAAEAAKLPGEIKLDIEGTLLKQYLTYREFVNYLNESFDQTMNLDIPRIIASTNIELPDGSVVTFDPNSITVVPPYDDDIKKGYTPQMCRDKHLTYAMTLYADMIQKNKQGQIINRGVKPKEIGTIPIPLGSEHCILHTRDRRNSDKIRASYGECPHDPLCYFIIQGQEKVLLIQEMLRPNKIFIVNKSSKGNVQAQMTCETPSGSKIVTLTIDDISNINLLLNGFKKDNTGKNNTIGIIQAFRILGYDNFDDIASLICRFTSSTIQKKIILALAPSFSFAKQFANDFESLGMKMLDSQKEIDEKKTRRGGKKKKIDPRSRKNSNLATPEGRKAAVLEVFQNELFPFVNDEPNPKLSKAYLLAMMVVKLVEYLVGFRPLDDRDSWSNKKVRSMKTMGQLFRVIWLKMIYDIEVNLAGSGTKDFQTVYNQFNAKIVRDTFISSFVSTNWGIRGKFVKQNMTQILKRDSLIQTYSHLTQIDVNTSRNDKQPSIRMVQNTQYGFICCVTGDTEILLADGTCKRIMDLNGNETIVTVNPTTLENHESQITCYYEFLPEKLLRIEDDLGNSIKCTPDHPFLCLIENDKHEISGKWVDAGKLQIGDKLLRSGVNSDSRNLVNGKSWACVKSISQFPEEKVYDITTELDNHSFIANGFITHNCVETPEGENAGIVKNMAVTASISLEGDERILRYNIGQYIDNDAKTTKKTTKCVVNGKFLGWVDAKVMMTEGLKLRRGNMIPRQTSFVHDRKDNVIYIYCDDGRPLRPLLIVNPETGKLVIEEKKLWRAEWHTLLSEGCVEYVDPWEQEFLEIATYRRDLEQYEHEKEAEVQKLIQQGATEDAIRAVDRRLKKREYTHCEMDPSALLGFAASIIPLPDHNQGPRNLFQCAMSKQALGLYHSNYLNRFDGTIKTLANPTRAIFEPQLSGMIGFNDLPAGQMVQMAFKTYTGFTQEDAFVFNRSSIQRGLFRMVKWSTYKTVVKRTNNYTEKLERPVIKKDEPSDKYIAIGEDGLPLIGAQVKANSCIIGKTRTTLQPRKVENVSEFMGVGEEGVIDAVFTDRNASTNEILVKVRVRDVRFPIIGDKFAPRFAQKGTIGLTLNQEDMPFVGDSPTFAETGKKRVSPAPTLDVIVNPACLTGDTRVSLGHGVSRTIKNLSSEGGEHVLAWDPEKSGFRTESQLGLEPRGKQKILKLTLEDGRVLRCTPDHKILTVKRKGMIDVYDWIQAKDLKTIGQYDNEKKEWLTNDDEEPATLLIGPEYPLDEPDEQEREIEKKWQLLTSHYAFDMRDRNSRELALAFARILGIVATDGCINLYEEQGKDVCKSNVYFGHILDVAACLKDVSLITGKVPKARHDGVSWVFSLPRKLARAIASIPGVMLGKRIYQESTWPQFLLEKDCPESIIREFLGTAFGGDGHTACLVRNTAENRKAKLENGDMYRFHEITFSKSTIQEFLPSLKTKMEQLVFMLERLGVEGGKIEGPITRNVSEDQKHAEDYLENPRSEYRVVIPNSTQFADKIGFKYCHDKQCKLMAANTYWRYLETVRRQHDQVVQQTSKFFDEKRPEVYTKSRPSMEKALNLARHELLAVEPPLNQYYSLSTLYDMGNRRKGSRSKTLDRLDYNFIYTPEQFLDRTGCKAWFNWNGSGEGNKVYAIKHNQVHIPKFKLRLLDKRDDGEQEVYDIGVSKLHSFVAGGIVVSNCLPSRMTMAYLLEILASKCGALKGERINATAFRPSKEKDFSLTLRDYGFHPQGYVQMYNGFTGKPEETLTFAGPCYFQALRHHVKDKYNARQCGSKKAATRVPIGGRKVRGAIRLKSVACVEYKPLVAPAA